MDHLYSQPANSCSVKLHALELMVENKTVNSRKRPATCRIAERMRVLELEGLGLGPAPPAGPGNWLNDESSLAISFLVWK